MVRECEHPFAEYLIADGAGVVDPQLPVLTKVLKMGGSYELLEKLWKQFVLTRDEVLVVFVIFRCHFVSILIDIVFLLLVNHLNQNAASISVTHGWVD